MRASCPDTVTVPSCNQCTARWFLIVADQQPIARLRTEYWIRRSPRTLPRAAIAECQQWVTDDLRVCTEQVTADQVPMAYIIERNNRFYVVAYDGADPLTGRERRKWHSAGRNRTDAEAIAATINDKHAIDTAETVLPMTVGRFLNEIWLPRRRTQLRPTTARRYE